MTTTHNYIFGMKVAKGLTDKKGIKDSRSNKTISFLPQKECAGNTGSSRAGEILPNKVSIDKLRTIWNDNEITYSDKELFRIREWLYVMAEVAISEFETRTLAQIIPLSPHTDNHSHNYTINETTQSDTLCPRIYRRAS